MAEREERMDAWSQRLGDKPPKTTESDVFTKPAAPKTPKSPNDRLAREAVEKLVAMNKGIVVTLLALKMPGTAMGISAEEDNFREMMYSALVADPELCRTIVRMGGSSGKLGVLFGYAALAYAVAPTAIAEFQAHPLREYMEKKRAEREEY